MESRGVAQPGSAPASGVGCRPFESARPDHSSPLPNNPTMIGVIGAASPPTELREVAYLVGKGIAERGWILVCGGRTGVMEESARGAWEAGGITVGILPSGSIEEANPYILCPVATGMGSARNSIIIANSKALVAVGGGYGTLSEISLALKSGKTVIGLKSWEIPGVVKAADAEHALRLLEDLV
jgi:uncharacterized protein (TIGR00725 family)